MTLAKKQSNGRKKKVWHITDFRELFELPDDLRKNRPGPLSYTKSFVTLTGISKEYEIKHFERLQELKSRPERHLLRSVFEDLKNWSGKKTIKHRGNLLTTAEQPATYIYLAAQLKMDVEELKQAMPILEEIGLIERVPMDTLSSDKQTTKTKKKRSMAASRTTKKSVQKKIPGKKKGEAPDTSGCIRTSPEASGKKRTALYKENGKRKGKRKSNSNGNCIQMTDNGNIKRKKNNNRQKSGRVNFNALEGKRKRKTKSATTDCRQAAVAPATTPPIMPQASDAGRSRVIPFPKASPGSVQNTRASPQRIGEVVKEMEHRYDVAAQNYAREIYQALRLPWHIDSPDAARQLGSFASVLHKSKKRNLSQSSIEELWNRAHLEAGRIAKRKDKNRNPGAVWCKVFKRLLTSKLSNQCKVM